MPKPNLAHIDALELVAAGVVKEGWPLTNPVQYVIDFTGSHHPHQEGFTWLRAHKFIKLAKPQLRGSGLTLTKAGVAELERRGITVN